jgi:hypothetical protein
MPMVTIMEIEAEDDLWGRTVVMETPRGTIWFAVEEGLGLVEEMPAPQNPHEALT